VLASSIIKAMMEAARTSETFVNFYQTTWRYNQEDSHLHACIRQWLSSGLRRHLILQLNTSVPRKRLGGTIETIYDA
jgi:hypothetical protein